MTRRPSVLACRLADTKPSILLTTSSVSLRRVRSSACWSPGSQLNMLMKVTRPPSARMSANALLLSLGVTPVLFDDFLVPGQVLRGTVVDPRGHLLVGERGARPHLEVLDQRSLVPSPAGMYSCTMCM